MLKPSYFYFPLSLICVLLILKFISLSEGKGVISNAIVNEGHGLSLESVISQMEERGYTRLLDIAYACHIASGGDSYDTLTMEIKIHADGTAKGEVEETCNGCISQFIQKITERWLFEPFDGTTTFITFNYSFSDVPLERGTIVIQSGKETIEDAVLNECVTSGYVAELNAIYAAYRSQKDSTPVKGVDITFEIRSDGYIQNSYVASTCSKYLSDNIEKAMIGWTFATRSLKPLNILYHFRFDPEIK